ncbi:MAG TPA: FAD-dependent oxidoreductase [Streptosporangiaceae bacterium]|nr:FAD-dependent oxidoreductase [Streptosporangiaceae bacterium]
MTQRVVVVGAGAVGLSCAFYLQRAGFEVVVLDAAAVGDGASWGNAGWVSPSLSAPIPGPAALRTALASIGRPASPLWLRPQPDPGFLLWGLGFLRHCTRRSSERGLAATALLSRDAFAYFDQMLADGLEVTVQRHGLLLIGTSAGSVEAELEELGRLGQHHILSDVTRLSAAECREREPLIGPDVAGGIFVSTEGHLDPRQLTAALARLITSRGAVIRAGQPVTGFVRQGGRITAVVAGAGASRCEVPAASVVIAAGAHSVPVARMLGARLPMTAGKGYSFSVAGERAPAAPIYLLETKAGVTPMAGRVRVAGTIEFSGINARLDPRRIEALKRAARSYLPGLAWAEMAEEWTGMRPMCPDGLPVLDRIPGVGNAFLATGHSTLGITLAAVTGAHMAAFVRDGMAPDALRPFRYPSYLSRPLSRLRLVGQQQHPCRGLIALGEPEPDGLGGAGEQPLSCSEHERVYEQPVLVDEIVLDQRPHEHAAAKNGDRSVAFPLEVAHRRRDVTRQDLGSWPVSVRQRAARDVLGARVEGGRDGVAVRLERPVRRHLLVRPAAEQVSHVVAEPPRGGAAGHLVAIRRRPAAVGEVAVAILVGRPEALHDAVKGHELDDCQFPHRGFLPAGRRRRRSPPTRSEPARIDTAHAPGRDRTLAGTMAKEAVTMDQRGFARAVADRTGLSREESADITWAVLEGLADQLSGGEARRLAADLADMGGAVRAGRRRRSEARPIRLAEFLGRLSERTGLNTRDAHAGAGAVLAQLQADLGEEQYRHLVGQLPAEYEDLAQGA